MSDAARARTLDEHLRAENAHDLEAIMATYGAAPFVEIGAQRFDGAEAIRIFHARFGFGGGEASFSEVRVEERHRHVAGAAIVVEAGPRRHGARFARKEPQQTLHGHHTGTWQRMPPTGRRFAVPVCTVYLFDAQARLQGERVYLDQALLRRQLDESRT